MGNAKQPSLCKRIRSAIRQRCLKPLWISVRSPWFRLRPRTVFIFGNQKTGSTAIAALLGEACGLGVSQDLFYRMTEPMEQRLLEGRTVLRSIVRAYKPLFAADIIKDPGLIFFFPALLECWPEGRFVFLIRDPRDNIRSILNRLDLSGDLRDLDAVHWDGLPNDLWRLILDGSLLGVRGANFIETQANRWNLALKIYHEHRDRMIPLRYEDFLVDKAGTIEQLAGRLGLGVQCDIRASVDIQYQPKGDHSVGWAEFFGEDNLGRIERICADGMEEFGYLPTHRG